MKRLLSFFLSLVILFTSIIPAYAAEPDYVYDENVYEYIEGFAYHIEGDCVYFENEKGQIIEIRANDISTYGLLSGFFTISSAGGAVAAGSATIAGYAIPVLIAITALGFVGYTPQAQADVTMSTWAKLSSTAKEKIKALAETLVLGGSFTLTADVMTEIVSAFNSTVTDNEGLYLTAIPSLNVTGCLEYENSRFNFNSDGFNGRNEKYTDIYQTALVYGTASAITGTDLTAELVDWVTSSGDVYPSIKLVNTVTGASAILFNGQNGTLNILNATCGGVFIAAPWVSTFTAVNGTSLEKAGHWFGIALGHQCSDSSCTVTQNASWTFNEKDATIEIDGTGTLLDGFRTKGSGTRQSIDANTGNFKVETAGGTVVSLPLSVLGTILSKDAAICVDSTLAGDESATEEKTLYFPDVMTDTNYLTPDSVITGEIGDAVAPPGTITPPSSDTTFLDKILGFLEALLAAVLGIPQKIVEALKGLADWLLDIIVQALKLAFIPSEDFFETFFSDLRDTFSDRFGILTYPISVLFRFLNSFLELSDTEPVISWGSWKYQGTEFIPAGSYNLSDIVKEGTFKTIYDIYLICIDAFLVFLLLRFIDNKYRSMIAN